MCAGGRKRASEPGGERAREEMKVRNSRRARAHCLASLRHSRALIEKEEPRVAARARAG